MFCIELITLLSFGCYFPLYWLLSEIHQQAHLFRIKTSNLLRTEGNAIEASAAGNVSQASTAVSHEDALEWVKKDRRRLLHVVYRVGDLEKTIKYVL